MQIHGGLGTSMERIEKQCSKLMNEINKHFSFDAIKTKTNEVKPNAVACGIIKNSNRILTCHGKLVTYNNAIPSKCSAEVTFIPQHICTRITKINHFITNERTKEIAEKSSERTVIRNTPSEQRLKTQHLSPTSIKPSLKMQLAYNICLGGEHGIKKRNNVAVHHHSHIENDELKHRDCKNNTDEFEAEEAVDRIPTARDLRSYLYHNLTKKRRKKQNKNNKQYLRLKKIRKTVKFGRILCRTISHEKTNRSKLNQYKEEGSNQSRINHLKQKYEEDEETNDNSPFLFPIQTVKKQGDSSSEKRITDHYKSEGGADSATHSETETVSCNTETIHNEMDEETSNPIHVKITTENDKENLSPTFRTDNIKFHNQNIRNRRFGEEGLTETENIVSVVDSTNSSNDRNEPFRISNFNEDMQKDSVVTSAIPILYPMHYDFQSRISEIATSHHDRLKCKEQNDNYVRLLLNIIKDSYTTTELHQPNNKTVKEIKSASFSNSNSTYDSSVSFGEIPHHEHLSPGEIGALVALKELDISSSSPTIPDSSKFIRDS